MKVGTERELLSTAESLEKQTEDYIRYKQDSFPMLREKEKESTNNSALIINCGSAVRTQGNSLHCAWRLHPKTKKARKGNVGTGLNGG